MWQYRLADLFADDDPQTWAEQLRDEGWEFAVRGTGVLVEINGVTRRRYYLRRWVEKRIPRNAPRTTTPRD